MNDEHLEKLLREIDEEDDYAWLKETNAELREKIGILFNKNKQLETDNAEINEKLDSKRKTIKSLCEELDSLRIVSIEIERLRIENKHLQESRPQSELDAAHLAAENAMLNINFARYISATQDTEKENERLASMVRELQDENAALREKAERYRLVTLKQDADNTALCNKLAALENQTQWECSCGGTDCEGQKENAALREDKEILDWMNNNIEAIMFKYKPDGFIWDVREIMRGAMAKEGQP